MRRLVRGEDRRGDDDDEYFCQCLWTCVYTLAYIYLYIVRVRIKR